MDTAVDLGVLLASHYPLLMAEERDEQRFLELLRRAAREKGLPVWTWSSVRGLARDGSSPQYQTVDPVKALKFVSAVEDPGVFVFLDAHPRWTNPSWSGWPRRSPRGPGPARR
jgi:hypothetical protein